MTKTDSSGGLEPIREMMKATESAQQFKNPETPWSAGIAECSEKEPEGAGELEKIAEAIVRDLSPDEMLHGEVFESRKWRTLSALQKAVAEQESRAEHAEAYLRTAEEMVERGEADTKRLELVTSLLLRARRNVEHSASHAAGAASRELLKEIDAAMKGEK